MLSSLLCYTFDYNMNHKAPGNFRTIEEARRDVGDGANCEIEAAFGQAMPPYCMYCARNTTRTIMVPVSSWTKDNQEAKAAGCLFLGFMLGRRFPLFAILQSAGAVSNGPGSHRDVSLPVCQTCSTSYGAPLAEMVSKSRVKVACCERFKERFDRGDGMDVY